MILRSRKRVVYVKEIGLHYGKFPFSMFIQNLSQSAVERVCASQVIPDLHSCVRELIENSVDAKASCISIRIRNAASEIEVADNGLGISKENWNSLFRSHHTSKLTEYESLLSGFITTHGFRGEALSSLCSLSTKVRIATRTGEQDAGYVLEFGKTCTMTNEPERVSKSVGTTITVYGLFEESLPVRYHEMLRTIKKEIKTLSSHVYELAIINPSISFELLVDGKCLINPISGSQSPYDVYKRLISGPELIEFSSACESASLKGWITPPVPTPWSLSAQNSSSSVGGQYFFLNGRPINPIKKLVKGINRLYGKFSIKRVTAILCLSIPENKNYFDINVAVNKREVLFCNGFDDMINNSVIQVLEDLFDKPKNEENIVTPTPQRNLVRRKRVLEAESETQPNKVLVHEILRAPETDIESKPPESQEEPFESIENQIAVRESDSVDHEELSQPSPQSKEPIEEWERYPIVPSTQLDFPTSISFPKELFREMSVMGQFNNGFIVTRLENVNGRSGELFLIDQHAANEKYLFEEYFRKIRLDYQRLIIPIKIRAPPWIEQVVIEHKETLARNGFLTDTGNDSDGNRCILLNSLPTLSGIGFNRSAALTVKDFMEMTEALNDGDATIAQSTSDADPLCLLKMLTCVRAHLASKACRTAIMVGDPLNPAKMTEIVHSLSTLDQPWNCPHGRPTMKHLLSLEDLNKFN